MKKMLLLVLLLSPMISFAGEYEKSMNMKDYESIYTEIVISIENTKDLSDTVVDKKLHKKIKRHIHTLKDVIKTPFYNPMTKEMKSSFTPNISLINRTIKTGNTLLNEIKSKYSLENSDINEVYSSLEKSNQFLEDMKKLKY